MLIRNKLLLATSIPIILLVAQVIAVNIFIRELQNAVQFINSAQNVIEADLKAKDLVADLRAEIRKAPQIYVESTNSVYSIVPLWQEIGRSTELINTSSATHSINPETVASVNLAYDISDREIGNLKLTLADSSPDLNALLLRAISSNNALVELDQKLSDLVVELRQQLQIAVDKEREIHNRPIIAAVLIGSLAVLLLIFLVWIFVDRGIIKRLTSLSQSMLDIAGGNLRTPMPEQKSTDEIGKMGQALAIFRGNAVEIQENNLREVKQARKQRQFWLENMASFLRHELKNKQVGAEQSIRLLVSKEGQNPQVMKYCERASESLMDIKELINSTVDATDIETALLSEDYKVLDINNLLQNYISKLNEQIDAEVVYLSNVSGYCQILGDRHRLEQLLDKLVSNALDFREPDTDVIIRLSRHNEKHMSINVETQGPALPENNQVLFGLSVSARKKENKQQGNVGFGLFVARRIAENSLHLISRVMPDNPIPRIIENIHVVSSDAFIVINNED